MVRYCTHLTIVYCLVYSINVLVDCRGIPNHSYLRMDMKSEDPAKFFANIFATVFSCGGSNQPECNIENSIKTAIMFKALGANMEQQLARDLAKHELKAKVEDNIPRQDDSTEFNIHNCIFDIFTPSLPLMKDHHYHQKHLRTDNHANKFDSILSCSGENQPKCSIDYIINMATMLQTLGANIELQLARNIAESSKVKQQNTISEDAND